MTKQRWIVREPRTQIWEWTVDTDVEFKSEAEFLAWWNETNAGPPDARYDMHQDDTGLETTYELVPAKPTTNLQCPACLSCGEFRYIEDISCGRNVILGEPGETPLKIHGFYETEGFDDGDNGRFECVACGHEWPVPKDLEIEWV